MKREITEKEGYLKASYLCARGEQCSHDIREKLIKWGLEREKADLIIEKLEEEKFIDNARFAIAFCRDKSKFQGWGKAKIKYNLKLKRINSDDIENALAEIDESIFDEKLESILKSKYRTLKNKEPQKQRASLYRFAISRGFDSQSALKMISTIINDSENDEY